MDWEISFHRGVKEQILAMPPKVQARFIRLLELMEKHGPNLGAPHGCLKLELKQKKESVGGYSATQKEDRYIFYTRS